LFCICFVIFRLLVNQY